MIVTTTQRWRSRKAIYRRPNEQIRRADYEVDGVDWQAARDFVKAHHYSGTWPSSRFRFGLFTHGQLVGVANFGVAANDKAITGALGVTDAQDGVELSRLVLLDSVLGNGESFFVAECFRRLKKAGLAGVISFSDPVARTDAEGRTVFRGHLGVVYQALNGHYLGRATPRTLKVLPDGRIFNERQLSKIRTLDQGVGYCVRDLVDYGADEPAAYDEPYLRSWLKTWTGRLCRSVRHGGNYKYAWSLSPAVKLPRSLPYPKWHARDA